MTPVHGLDNARALTGAMLVSLCGAAFAAPASDQMVCTTMSRSLVCAPTERCADHREKEPSAYWIEGGGSEIEVVRYSGAAAMASWSASEQPGVPSKSPRTIVQTRGGPATLVLSGDGSRFALFSPVAGPVAAGFQVETGTCIARAR